MGPSRPGVKRQRPDEDADEEAEAELWGGQRGSRRTGSPEVRRLVRDAPVIRRPARFEDNVPPNFSPMKVRHEGRLHPMCFIKY